MKGPVGCQARSGPHGALGVPNPQGQRQGREAQLVPPPRQCQGPRNSGAAAQSGGCGFAVISLGLHAGDSHLRNLKPPSLTPPVPRRGITWQAGSSDCPSAVTVLPHSLPSLSQAPACLSGADTLLPSPAVSPCAKLGVHSKASLPFHLPVPRFLSNTVSKSGTAAALLEP